jgi:hypothetical protein
MKWLIPFLISLLIFFFIGWIFGNITTARAITIPEEPKEMPSSPWTTMFGIMQSAKERISPYDRISENQIHVYNDRIVIDLQNAEWASFTDTNSMDPVIDKGANAIQIVPHSPDDIHLGDIVSYKSSLVSGTIIHRVVKIGQDSEGWYAILKGDNLSQEDPEKVRFDQVQRVVVAIIY